MLVAGNLSPGLSMSAALIVLVGHGFDSVGDSYVSLLFKLELLMMNKIFGVIALALGLIACGDSAIKSEVKSLLIDPSSAEFKSITVFKDGNYCGEVNSKNRMGGYAGYKAFSKVDGKLEIHDVMGLERLCEIAKDPVTHKCTELDRRIKYYASELKKDNPVKGAVSREWIENKKIESETEFTLLMCANKLFKN